MNPLESGQDARTTVARPSLPAAKSMQGSSRFLRSQDGRAWNPAAVAPQHCSFPRRRGRG